MGVVTSYVPCQQVFHVPKNPELDLEGWEGTIVEIVRFFKGAELSANLPYKVQFQLEVDGKPKKFLAHLVSPAFNPLLRLSRPSSAISHSCVVAFGASFLGCLFKFTVNFTSLMS